MEERYARGEGRCLGIVHIEKTAPDLASHPAIYGRHILAIDQWLTEQQNGSVDDDRDRGNCTKCGSAVRNTGERDGLIFFICDTCGLRGAYSVPSRGSRAGSIRHSTTSSES
jgi:hypothetical protein